MRDYVMAMDYIESCINDHEDTINNYYKHRYSNDLQSDPLELETLIDKLYRRIINSKNDNIKSFIKLRDVLIDGIRSDMSDEQRDSAIEEFNLAIKDIKSMH